MAQFAIQGHRSEGDKVIKILETLGGINPHNYIANHESLYFYIAKEDSTICYDWINCPRNTDVIIFYYEDFIKRFPHKIGDKVCFPDDLSTPFTINKMWWDGNANELLCSFVEDDIDVPVVGVRAYKGESSDKTNKVIFEANTQSCDIMNDIIKEEDMENGIIYDEIDFDRCPAADKVHLILGDNYEIKKENGNYYVVRKKPQYPKTYKECCKIMQSDPNFYIDTHLYSDKLDSLYKLLICRNAYWKIAGEKMGLGKAWEPDWRNPSERKYCIVNTGGNIEKWVQKTTNKILAFPTEEMRDAFYENFKDLIEECKEFL